MRQRTHSLPLSRHRGEVPIARRSGIALTIVLLFVLAGCAGNPPVPVPLPTPPTAANATVPATVPKYVVMLPACPSGDIFALDGAPLLINSFTYYLHVQHLANPPLDTASSMIWADAFPAALAIPTADGLPAGPLRDNLTADAIGVCDHRSAVPVFEEYPKTYA